MNKVVTRAAFMRLLRALLPPVKDSGSKYRLPEWHVVCLRCGEVIPHHYTDKVWNGRYLDHRRDVTVTHLAYIFVVMCLSQAALSVA